MLLRVTACKKRQISLIILFHSHHAGIKKKLQKLGKTKDCELVQEWIRSIVNHLYWSVSSSADGKPEEIQAKWTSLDNHVHNVHRGHSIIFKKCLHKKLTGRKRKKKCFKRRKLMPVTYYSVDKLHLFYRHKGK